MSETTQVMMQATPNPNAMKFIIDQDVIAEGKRGFDAPEACRGVPLAEELFRIPHVSQIHFFENVITVTQDGGGDWDALENQVTDAIRQGIDAHNPDLPDEGAEARRELSPELQAIDDILGRTVRPALQADGGDLDVVSLEGNVLTISYQGACGSCPSAIMGTLEAIKSILRAEYDPEIDVQLPADAMGPDALAFNPGW
jgi:Fe-S cluster biogenesis protein NfuA